jgi:hypothetical protein
MKSLKWLKKKSYVPNELHETFDPNGDMTLAII